MKAIADFLPRVTPYAVGCSDPMAAQAVVDAAIAFCEDSLVLRELIDPFPTVVGEASYELEAPSQQQVARVMEVWVDGYQLEAVPYEGLDALRGSAYSDTPQTGQPRAFYTTRKGSELLLHVFPLPDKVQTLRVEAAMRPMRNARMLEDDLYNLWLEHIVAGALARIKSIPDMPFTDIAGAYALSMSATSMARRARIEGSYGRVKGNLTVRPRSFSRGNR